MDDMFFRCNKNTIYVLNTNYAYGEFGHLNLFGTSNHLLTDQQKSQSLASSKIYPAESSSTTPSVSSCSFQNFFRLSNYVEHKLLSSDSQYEKDIFRKQYQYQLKDQQQQQHQHQQRLPNLENSSLKSTTNAINIAKKSTTAVKSAIIAKKAKFWQYLEEEKWKKNSLENLPNNCKTNRDEHFLNNSTTNSHSANISASDGSKNNKNNKKMEKSSSRSRSSDNRSSSSQQQQQISSTDFYRETAQLLGLPCTLCDNCRCLDCQSRYFECDDSDSFSETSFMGEYFEQLQEQHDLFKLAQNDFNRNCTISNNTEQCTNLVCENNYSKCQMKPNFQTIRKTDDNTDLNSSDCSVCSHEGEK